MYRLLFLCVCLFLLQRFCIKKMTNFLLTNFPFVVIFSSLGLIFFAFVSLSCLLSRVWFELTFLLRCSLKKMSMEACFIIISSRRCHPSVSLERNKKYARCELRLWCHNVFHDPVETSLKRWNSWTTFFVEVSVHVWLSNLLFAFCKMLSWIDSSFLVPRTFCEDF